MSEYVLGTSERERERLELQQRVFAPITSGFLDRVGVRRGARVLDLGCGPGLVTVELRERVGEEGEVVALDESESWKAPLQRLVSRHGWSNVRPVRARIEEVELEPDSFDLVFARWVLSFLADPQVAVERVARWLAPGGALAVIDYNHEGISCFPKSKGFEALIRATRDLYASRGGDLWLAGRLPRLFAQAGLATESYQAHVLCGGPDSDAFRWMDAFFPAHAAGMVAAGVLAEEERARFEREWEERRRDSTATFFSPIVVTAAGRRA